MRRSSTASRVREAGDNCHLNLTKSGSYKYTIQRLAIANAFLNQNQIHETALRDNTAWASIYIDQNLNFSTQTDNICNKAKRTLAALKRAAPLLSTLFTQVEKHIQILAMFRNSATVKSNISVFIKNLNFRNKLSRENFVLKLIDLM